jgi:hypothetical protein
LSHWRWGLFIELSQETNRWAQIQIPDNIWLDRTLSGQGFLGSVFEFWSGSSRAEQYLARPDNVRLEVSVCG